MTMQRYLKGIRDGLPIGLGYLAVAFSIGIACKNAGLDTVQSFLLSALNNAAAGQYSGLTIIAANGAIVQLILIVFIANARYLLMSCSLGSRLSPDLPLRYRFLMGFILTDELFGAAIAQPGYITPSYYFGAISSSIPFWALGTVIGQTAGAILPGKLVIALGVALYGMFLATIIPKCRTDVTVGKFVVLAFLMSSLFAYLPGLKAIPEGTRTIILTIGLSAAAAILHPVKVTDSGQAQENVRAKEPARTREPVRVKSPVQAIKSLRAIKLMRVKKPAGAKAHA